MEYTFLGPSGLKVSKLAYGNWLTCNDENGQEYANKCVAKAWELGINYFDTAEVYGKNPGEGEIQMGKALKKLNVPREKLMISTKFWRSCNFDAVGKERANQEGLSRKHLIEAIQNSLKRLQLEYVDIIFAHRFDHETPIEETCRAFNYLINKGYTFYWGTSKWTQEQIASAHRVCDRLGLIKPIAEQCQYNMFVRQQFEAGYRELFSEYQMGSTIFSALAGGILTGKYNKGIEPGTRLAEEKFQIFYQEIFLKPEIYEKRLVQLNQLEQIAKENNITQGQLALAWALYNKNVSTAIIGSRTPEQLEEDVKALEFLAKYTKELDDTIEIILENTPEQIMNYKTCDSFEKQR